MRIIYGSRYGRVAAAPHLLQHCRTVRSGAIRARIIPRRHSGRRRRHAPVYRHSLRRRASHHSGNTIKFPTVTYRYHSPPAPAFQQQSILHSSRPGLAPPAPPSAPPDRHGHQSLHRHRTALRRTGACVTHKGCRFTTFCSGPPAAATGTHRTIPAVPQFGTAFCHCRAIPTLPLSFRSSLHNINLSPAPFATAGPAAGIAQTSTTYSQFQTRTTIYIRVLLMPGIRLRSHFLQAGAQVPIMQE